MPQSRAPWADLYEAEQPREAFSPKSQASKIGSMWELGRRVQTDSWGAMHFADTVYTTYAVFKIFQVSCLHLRIGRIHIKTPDISASFLMGGAPTFPHGNDWLQAGWGAVPFRWAGLEGSSLPQSPSGFLHTFKLPAIWVCDPGLKGIYFASKNEIPIPGEDLTLLIIFLMAFPL